MEMKLELPGDGAQRQLQELDKQLLVLRLSAGKLEAALQRCFAPLAAVVLPAVTAAVRSLTAFFDDAAAVISELFGFVRRSADKTVTYTGKAIKRSLAGFDQLERLSGGSGGSGSYTVPGEILKLPERLRPVVEKLRELLKPLQELDFSAASAAFEELKTAVSGITRQLFEALEWVWFNILVPIAQWGVEEALPLFLETLATAFDTLGIILEECRPVLDWLWNELLVPLGQWAGETVLEALRQLNDKLRILGEHAAGSDEKIDAFVGRLTDLKNGILGVKSPVDDFQTALGKLKNLAEGLKTAFEDVATAVGKVFTKVSELFTGLPNSFRTLANGLISVLNTAITAVENGVNAMVRTLRSFSITIPAWVPGLGGKTFSIQASTVDLPNIPYLARGAVLPANKPFLAMVGDQRNGTNIEAPLSLIEEAVANVLGANLAGQDAANQLLRNILAAVQDIRVGDEVIGRAARRYEDRMAVMGGVL